MFVLAVRSCKISRAGMDGSGAFPGGDCGGSCRVGLSGPRVAQVWCLGEVSGASGKVRPRSRVMGAALIGARLPSLTAMPVCRQ